MIARNMRKIVTLLLILFQFTISALSESPLTDFVAAQGFEVHASETQSSINACCFTEAENGVDVLAWTEAGRAFSVNGASGSADLKDLYVALLGMADWESCAYFIPARESAQGGFKGAQGGS